MHCYQQLHNIIIIRIIINYLQNDSIDDAVCFIQRRLWFHYSKKYCITVMYNYKSGNYYKYPVLVNLQLTSMLFSFQDHV